MSAQRHMHTLQEKTNKGKLVPFTNDSKEERLDLMMLLTLHSIFYIYNFFFKEEIAIMVDPKFVMSGEIQHCPQHFCLCTAAEERGRDDGDPGERHPIPTAQHYSYLSFTRRIFLLPLPSCRPGGGREVHLQTWINKANCSPPKKF